MLIYALIAFGAGALAGLVLANTVLRGQFASWTISLLHAALGATGLVLLIVAVMNGAANPAKIALGLLLVAALGGFFLASFHLRKALPPKGVVFLHAGLAVAGFVMLAGTALNLV
jgi:hypothetical protein